MVYRTVVFKATVGRCIKLSLTHFLHEYHDFISLSAVNLTFQVGLLARSHANV